MLKFLLIPHTYLPTTLHLNNFQRGLGLDGVLRAPRESNDIALVHRKSPAVYRRFAFARNHRPDLVAVSVAMIAHPLPRVQRDLYRQALGLDVDYLIAAPTLLGKHDLLVDPIHERFYVT